MQINNPNDSKAVSLAKRLADARKTKVAANAKFKSANEIVGNIGRTYGFASPLYRAALPCLVSAYSEYADAAAALRAIKK